jgi:hypothetical protein
VRQRADGKLHIKRNVLLGLDLESDPLPPNFLAEHGLAIPHRDSVTQEAKDTALVYHYHSTTITELTISAKRLNQSYRRPIR